MKPTERLKLEDGTLWPNPQFIEERELIHRLIHYPEELTKYEHLVIAGVVGAYIDLIRHPAWPLKRVTQIISGIRKALK